MKKTIVVSMLTSAVLFFSSCGNKTNQVPFDNGDSLEIAQEDPSVYGVCGPATAMNTLQLITDTGDTLTLDISKAQENNKVLGGLHSGDRMTVVPSADRTGAEIVINQTALLGNWVMPNPIDGSEEVGIRIKEGGIAESIKQNTILYRTWRLTRGQLEIVLIREGGSEEEELYIYDIVKLAPDSLILEDSEDRLEYGRQRPHEEYNTDIKLEDSSFDDFKM